MNNPRNAIPSSSFKTPYLSEGEEEKQNID
jgi:hypothetical protein